MFYQIFVSAQAKRCAIATYKNGIYELPHELLKVLKFRILENYEISGNGLIFIERYPSAQSPCKNEIFVNTGRKLLKNRN